MITEGLLDAKCVRLSNFQGGTIMNNCLCNLFNDNWVWLIILAIILFSCCGCGCGGNSYRSGCGCG